jgi:ribosomal protein S19
MSRSKWKGPYISFTNFKSSDNNKIKIQELPRSFEITPKIVGLNFKVHTGKNFVKIIPTTEMIGHKVGEFAPTREKFVFKKKKQKKK